MNVYWCRALIVYWCRALNVYWCRARSQQVQPARPKVICCGQCGRKCSLPPPLLHRIRCGTPPPSTTIHHHRCALHHHHHHRCALHHHHRCALHHHHRCALHHHHRCGTPIRNDCTQIVSDTVDGKLQNVLKLSAHAAKVSTSILELSDKLLSAGPKDRRAEGGVRGRASN